MSEAEVETGDTQWWVERDDCNHIGHALSEAYEAFDLAYHQSNTATDLRRNTKAVIAALNRVLDLTADAECRCFACIGNERVSGGMTWLTYGMTTMIVCPKCGNKRCPHGTDHRNECTASNEPNQPGSRYGGIASPTAGTTGGGA